MYLTEAQERALDAQARADGATRSAVLRSILDDALKTAPGEEDLDAAFAELAITYATSTNGLFDDDPDLRID